MRDNGIFLQKICKKTNEKTLRFQITKGLVDPSNNFVFNYPGNWSRGLNHSGSSPVIKSKTCSRVHYDCEPDTRYETLGEKTRNFVRKNQVVLRESQLKDGQVYFTYLQCYNFKIN